jgi:putative MATE family efflux protein
MSKSGQLEALDKAPLGRLLFAYSWPALVAMALNSLYAVVDRFYIGSGCGESAMAALTLSFPVVMIFIAFGVWVGMGHSALLSIKLGEGNRVAAEKILGEMLALKTLFFFLLLPPVLYFIDPLLRLSGGAEVSGETLELAKQYLRITLGAHIFSNLAFGLSAMLRSEGGARDSMLCMLIGFGLNLVLDPLFIFSKKIEFGFAGEIHSATLGFGMGISGAAWATAISMIASFAWILWRYVSGRTVVRLHFSRIGIFREYLFRSLTIGLAPFLQQLMGAVVNFSLQMSLAKWARDTNEATLNIAALGVFQATMLFFIMPVFGLQQGVSPIMGYNWGARNYARVRESLMLGLMLTTIVVATASLSMFFFPDSIARLFSDGNNPEYIKVAAKTLEVSNCMLWCIGLNISMTTFFQSIGRPRMAILLSMLRQCVCLVPCIWFLPCFFEDRVFGVWLALPISDLLACLATIPPFVLYARFLKFADLRLYRKSAS